MAFQPSSENYGNFSQQKVSNDPNNTKYKCICGKYLIPISDASRVYGNNGAACDDCGRVGNKNEMFWHCNEQTDTHSDGYDVCNFCVNSSKYQFEVKCEDLRECNSMRQLLAIIKSYNNIESLNILSIINDFLHCIFTHNDDDTFKVVADTLGICNLESCEIFRRNYRDRGKMAIDNKKRSEIYAGTGTDAVYSIGMLQVLDKIHCYFMHSYHIGNKLSIKDETKINSIDEQKFDEDDIKTYISNKNIIALNKISLNQRNVITKMFHGDLSNRIISKYNQLSNPVPNNNKMYSFGHLFVYDVKEKIGQELDYIEVNPKYSSLKQELISNNIFVISLEQFNCAYNKA
eukprot:461200_1